MGLRRYFILSLLPLLPSWAAGFTPPEPPKGSPQVLQDPQSRVTYYLESDRRHVSAISSDGNLLWCCEVIPVAKQKWSWVISIDDKPTSESLDVAVAVVGQRWGAINKKTGALRMSSTVQ
jgi:hypothetical protein